MNLDRQKRLADNIRCLRTIYGYTQAEVADSLHICRSTYALFENGKTIPATDTLFALADFYQVKIETLLQSEASTAISQLMLPKQEKGPVLQLIDTYYRLSPHGQGKLMERAEVLLESELLAI